MLPNCAKSCEGKFKPVDKAKALSQTHVAHTQATFAD
jgi:hypothetical protein